MPRFTLHIGAHKTGTTYLQRVFHALRPALETAGIVFPSFWSQSDDQPELERLHQQLWASYGNLVAAPRLEGRFFAPRTRDIPYAQPLQPLTALYQAFQAANR